MGDADDVDGEAARTEEYSNGLFSEWEGDWSGDSPPERRVSEFDVGDWTKTTGGAKRGESLSVAPVWKRESAAEVPSEPMEALL